MGAKRKTSGFTLIEIMLVVAIIGILSAVAIPAYQDYAYQDYAYRSRVAESFGKASSIKTKVVENAASGNAFDSGITAPSDQKNDLFDYAVSPTNGNITITALSSSRTPTDAVNKTIILHPSCIPQSGTTFTALSASTPCTGPISWTCTAGGVSAQAGTASSPDVIAAASDAMSSKYVPAECRGTKVTSIPGAKDSTASIPLPTASLQFNNGPPLSANGISTMQLFNSVGAVNSVGNNVSSPDLNAYASVGRNNESVLSMGPGKIYVFAGGTPELPQVNKGFYVVYLVRDSGGKVGGFLLNTEQYNTYSGIIGTTLSAKK